MGHRAGFKKKKRAHRLGSRIQPCLRAILDENNTFPLPERQWQLINWSIPNFGGQTHQAARVGPEATELGLGQPKTPSDLIISEF